MIDVHCHILPGVDDGSDSLQTSLLMAANAADDKVKYIIATPHYTWDGQEYVNPIPEIWKRTNALQEELEKAGIPITLFWGAEVLLRAKADNRIPHIQGTNYSLVEFDFNLTLEKMDSYLRSVQTSGTRVIVAHPERYHAVQRSKDILLSWAKSGYYLQLNKGSYYGQFGPKAKKVAEWMLDHKLADLVGSDAHNATSRTTHLYRFRADIAKRCGKDYAIKLTRTNALRLLRNEPLKKD